MADNPGGQHPDDWQQLASQHREAQFAENVRALEKQARRGNRMIGCLFIGCGVLVLLGGLILALDRSTEKITIRDIRILWICLSGSVVTIGVGFAIWRGRRGQ
jgi:hypothetical protein